MLRTVLMGAFELVAVLVCLSWIWVNAYHYYPMLATGLGALTGRANSVLQQPFSSDSAPARDPIDRPGSMPRTLSEEELPTIDVLLPAYEESAVIENSIESVRATDYPHAKLSLTVLLEPDDDDTWTVLERIQDEYAFDVLTVPEGYPGDPNKPRALNYGFERTDADVVSITDAEDVVHPQLYRAVAEKLAAGHDYVQGRLDMVNENDGWMNLLFRAEYGYWYMVNTWAKYNREYPIPLGGTTCFFPRSLLETMSDRRLEKYGNAWSATDLEWVRDHGLEGYRPWDPKNVTEDFELGLFLWQEGYRAGYLKSTATDEESPLSLHAWVRQRTRWKKGKIYTFLQYLEHPPRSLREKVHIYSQSAVPHLGPINLVAVLVLLLGANLFGYPLHPVTSTALIAGFLLAVLMITLYVYGYWTASDVSFGRRVRRATVVGLTLPMYWFIQWIADVRALRQTYAGELHWAKTTHFGRNVVDDEVIPAGAVANGGTDSSTATAVRENGGMARENGGMARENGGMVRENDSDETEHRDSVPGEEESTMSESETSLSLSTRMLALCSIVSFGVGLRAYQLADWSLYGDELYSITARGSLPVRELLTVPIPLDSHPPLYYLLLHYWMEVFGNSVASARSLSVVLAAGSMVLLYFLATDLFDAQVGLLATAFFAVSTFHIHYGRIARMYSLFVFLTLASWYGFVQLRRGTTSSVLGYAVSSALIVYTHVFGLFVLLAQFAYVALSEGAGGIGWRRWLRVQMLVGVLALPWLAKLVYHVYALVVGIRGGTIIDWVPKPTFGIITNTVLRYVGWPHHFPLLRDAWTFRAVAAVLVITYAVCFVFAAVRLSENDEFTFANLPVVGQLSSLLVVPIVIPFVASYLVVPVYFPRFTIPASIAVFVLAAAGVMNVPGKERRAVLVAIILVSSAVLIGAYHTTDTAADWEGSADCLNEGVVDGDAVLYQPFWIQEYLQYYQRTPGTSEYGTLPPDDWTATLPYGLNASQVRDIAAEDDRIWVVQYQVDDGGRLLSVLRETHTVTVARDYGELRLYRLDRNASDAMAMSPGSAPELVNVAALSQTRSGCTER